MNHKKIAKLVQILKAYLKLELHCSKTRQIMSKNTLCRDFDNMHLLKFSSLTCCYRIMLFIHLCCDYQM